MKMTRGILNAFDGLVSTLDMAEVRISELQKTSIEIPKTKKSKENKDRGRQNRAEYTRTVGPSQNHNFPAMEMPEEAEKTCYK